MQTLNRNTYLTVKHMLRYNLKKAAIILIKAETGCDSNTAKGEVKRIRLDLKRERKNT